MNNPTEFSASQTYVEKLHGIDNITTHMNKTSVEFLSDENDLFHGLVVRDNNTNEKSLIQADGVFVFIGLIPNTVAFKNIIELDERGFIQTSTLAETSVRGIFAAGDCREGAIAQVAAATGEGVLASYVIRNYLK